MRDTSSVAALWKIKVDLVDWFGYPLLVYHCNGAGREHHTGGDRILPDTLYLPTHDRQISLIFQPAIAAGVWLDARFVPNERTTSHGTALSIFLVESAGYSSESRYGLAG